MLGKELISIAVCTYNGENFLAQQLDSLVIQSYPNLEIIIVDDKSSDNTWNILKEYEKNYSFISIYQNEQNLGYIKNFEKAIRLCTGDYITLCDQDDIWESKKITKLYKTIRPDDMLIYHNSALITMDGSSSFKNTSKSIGYISGTKKNRTLLLNNCIAGHAMMFQKRLLDQVLPIPNTMPHDHWIAYIASTLGNINYIDEPLVEYRQHTTSVTYSQHLKDSEDITDPLIEKINKRTELNANRLRNLNTILRYKGNNTEDIAFIKKLICYLGDRDKKLFSFNMFIFLLINQNSLFELYHKSFLSTAIMIYKECIGNRLKMIFK